MDKDGKKPPADAQAAKPSNAELLARRGLEGPGAARSPAAQKMVKK